jgi:hypothetical protein
MRKGEFDVGCGVLILAAIIIYGLVLLSPAWIQGDYSRYIGFVQHEGTVSSPAVGNTVLDVEKKLNVPMISGDTASIYSTKDGSIVARFDKGWKSSGP